LASIAGAGSRPLVEGGGVAGAFGQVSAGVGSPRGDLDLTASTDGEDLFVFAADVFEFSCQDLFFL